MFAMTVAWIVAVLSGALVSAGVAVLIMGVIMALRGDSVKVTLGWLFWLAALALPIAIAYIVTGGN